MKNVLFPLLLAGLMACNASLLEQPAPELVSSSWVLPDGAAQPATEDAWRLYAFFLPT